MISLFAIFTKDIGNLYFFTHSRAYSEQEG